MIFFQLNLSLLMTLVCHCYYLWTHDVPIAITTLGLLVCQHHLLLVAHPACGVQSGDQALLVARLYKHLVTLHGVENLVGNPPHIPPQNNTVIKKIRFCLQRCTRIAEVGYQVLWLIWTRLTMSSQTRALSQDCGMNCHTTSLSADWRRWNQSLNQSSWEVAWNWNSVLFV